MKRPILGILLLLCFVNYLSGKILLVKTSNPSNHPLKGGQESGEDYTNGSGEEKYKSKTKIGSGQIAKVPGKERKTYSQEDAALAAVVEGNEEFAGRLFSEALLIPGSLVLSPLSVSTVLAMVAMGASGATRAQLLTGLALPDNCVTHNYGQLLHNLTSDSSFTLETANRMYLQEGHPARASFQRKLTTLFNASTAVTNFGDSEKSAKLINDWVEEKTKDKIKDLINPTILNKDTRMVLINAIYFKAEWKIKFERKKTKKVPFFSDSKEVNVEMMHVENRFENVYLKELKSQVLRLPYKNDKVVMEILLPDAKHGLKQVEKKLKSTNIQALLNKNKFYNNTIKVFLPKFQIETTLPLNQILKDLGMTGMFDGGLEGITGDPDLSVSSVLQKAFIEVNEDGAEAAAATTAVGATRSLMMTPTFKADHPFLFYLREATTGLLLFQGRVVNPSQGGQGSDYIVA